MSPRTLPVLLLLCVTLPLGAQAPQPSGVEPVQLRCEYADDPLGIDVAAPRLFWQLRSAERGQRQTAWQVIVARSADTLAQGTGDLWDSGRVAGSDTAHVRYAGAALASSQQVFWKVRAWDRHGRPSPWSAVATWTMGVLSPAEWAGTWIAAPAASETLLLRKAVTVGPGLRRAVVHVSGLGHYELTVNGSKVGADLLSPGWTNYARTALYDTYDVTDALREGRNAVGLFLGNGMYHVVRRNRFAKFTGSFGPLRANLHLRLEFADGTAAVVGTDGTWRTHDGPVTYSSIYGGEDHDARLEPRGWQQPDFDDRGWAPAVPVIRLEDTLRGHSAASEPVRAVESRAPAAVRPFPDGTTVYDFGQNASFMPRIRVAGPAGSTVRLTPAEVVTEDGRIFRGTMGSAARGSSWWQYTKATDGEETWFPRFYYVGSRYLQAEFFAPGDAPPTAVDRPGHGPQADPARLPRLVAIEAVFVQAAVRPAGTFAAGNPRLARIRDLVRWAQRSNMVSVLTDCPHREKLGWIEQFHLNGPSVRYEFDTARLFTKAMRDMAEAQTDEGLVPNIAPEYTVFKGPYRNAAEWGAAFILVPWQQYLFTGDTGLLREHYDAMAQYLAFLASREKDGLLTDGLGDWYDYDPAVAGRANLTPAPVTATAYYYADLAAMAAIAGVLGKPDDADAWTRQAAAVRDRYNRTFFDAATPGYATGSQASLAIPVALGLAPPGHAGPLVAALAADLDRRGYATAGDIGFRSLLRALADHGRSDAVYRLIDRDDRPGYGFQIRKGNTTLAEAWDANWGVSQNHFILGQIIEWFYHDLAGIRPDAAAPGFAHAVIRPQPVPGLDWAEATYASIRGPISSRWERRGGQLVLTVAIPANVTATVYVPARAGVPVLEGGIDASAAAGVTAAGRDGDAAVFRVESGRYVFTAAW